MRKSKKSGIKARAMSKAELVDETERLKKELEKLKGVNPEELVKKSINMLSPDIQAKLFKQKDS